MYYQRVQRCDCNMNRRARVDNGHELLLQGGYIVHRSSKVSLPLHVALCDVQLLDADCPREGD